MVPAGFEGVSGGVNAFIYVVSVVMRGIALTMRLLRELGCVAGVLVGFVCLVVCMSRCFP